jgi:hypothetical protein
METIEEKKIRRTVDKSLLKGSWRLKYKIVNRLGLGGFGGKMLTVYNDAITGRSRFLHDLNGKQQTGYFIENQVTIFNPEENPEHLNILDWLIGHPEVWVEPEHAKVQKAYMNKKNENSRITLVNLDHQSIENLEEEDYIDKLVGRIVLDGGPNAIGIEKLRFVLAKLQMPYMESKYMNNQKVEKPILQKRLKTFVRSGLKNAEEVNKILENLDEAKYIYEIQEMMRFGILYVANGMFKHDSHPIGISTESVIKYFMQNPDFYTKLNEDLSISHRSEIKHSK